MRTQLACSGVTTLSTCHQQPLHAGDSGGLDMLCSHVFEHRHVAILCIRHGFLKT